MSGVFPTLNGSERGRPTWSVQHRSSRNASWCDTKGPKDRVIHMSEKARLNIFGRRRFLEVATGALAVTQLIPVQVADAGLVLDAPIQLAQSEGASSSSSLKQIDAGVLDVGYVEAGPVDGPAVILLHGWP